MAMKKRGRTTSDTGTSFFSKQFSLSGNQNDVVTQPPKTSSTTSEISKLANSVLKTTTNDNVQKIESQKLENPASKSIVTNGYGSGTTSSSSNVLDTIEQINKYKPVTTFKPQERVNPFDKENKPAGSSSTISAHSNILSSSSSGFYSGNSITESTGKMDVMGTENFNTVYVKSNDCKLPPEINKNTILHCNSSTTSISSISSKIYSNNSKLATKSPTYNSISNQSLVETSYLTKSTEPVLDKPLYGKSETSIGGGTAHTLERKISDADIIFGDKKPYICGTERLSRAGGSLSDADVIFEGVDKVDRYTSRYRSESSFLSKSMSVSSNKTSSESNERNKPSLISSHKIHEGIQNVAFQDYETLNKTSSTEGNYRSMPSEDSDIDLK